MAFDNTYTAVTGATYAASDYNTYVKGNFTAVWVGTTAGDIDYYTSSTAKNRLALVTGGVLYGGASAPAYTSAGSNHKFLKYDSGVAFGPLVYRRQGGNATNWHAGGTTTYTPTNTLVQAGTRTVTLSAGVGSAAITYPTTFTERPVILVSVDNSSGRIALRTTSAATTGFTIQVNDVDTGATTADVSWLAIGG